MSLRTAVRCQIVVALALLFTLSSAAVAQEGAPPKADIFAGYAWATPGPVFFNTSKKGASGGAIDITFDSGLAGTQQAALRMKRGGVGWYPNSHFIHLDSGPARSWELDSKNFGPNSVSAIQALSMLVQCLQKFAGGEIDHLVSAFEVELQLVSILAPDG